MTPQDAVYLFIAEDKLPGRRFDDKHTGRHLVDHRPEHATLGLDLIHETLALPLGFVGTLFKCICTFFECVDPAYKSIDEAAIGRISPFPEFLQGCMCLFICVRIGGPVHAYTSCIPCSSPSALMAFLLRVQCPSLRHDPPSEA